MKERRDILNLNRKTSLLMKINSHCWLRASLQRSQCIFVILWKYSNKRRTVAAALIAKISLTSPIVINMSTRELLAVETKSSFV